MYKKVLNPKSRRNKKSCAVFVDGIKFPSLFSATIEFGFSYFQFFTRLRKNNWQPVTYSGHLIVTEKWLKKNNGQFPLFTEVYKNTKF